MRPWTWIGLFFLTVPCAAIADVNVPPGYYLVNLTNEGFNRSCNINNHGQIVWYGGVHLLQPNTYEIMLYDHGEIRQVTNNNLEDSFPSINDAGQIVWQARTGPVGAREVWLYENGIARKIQDESLQAIPRDNWGPEINENGTVVWSRRSPTPECDVVDSELWLYDGTKSVQITNLGKSNQVPRINNAGDVVWTHYNFCVSPFEAQIMLFRNGVVEALSDPDQVSQGAAITDSGQVFWTSPVDTQYEYNIMLWEDGVATEYSPWGLVSRVSENGILGFNRWFEFNQTWQVMIGRNGEISQLTDGVISNGTPAVNSCGEVVWLLEQFPDYQVRAILRFSAGDMNCDHQFGLGDIPAFVLAVARPAVYDEIHPSCDALLADMNEDGAVSVGDIAGFVSILLTD